MNVFTLDILLKFLYDQFIGAFVWCLAGSVAREFYDNKKTVPNRKNKKVRKRNIDVAGMLISPLFSALLACGCTGYIKELRVEVYLLICIVLGIWGKTIMKCIMDGKFLYNFCTSAAKNIANPIIKSIVDSASKTLEDENKEKDKQQNDKKETEENKKE